MTIQNKLIVIVITLAVGIALYLRFKDGIAPFLSDIGSNIGTSVKGGFDSRFKPFEKTDAQKETEKQQAIFDTQVKQKEQDAKDAGYTNVEDYEKATDTNNDPLKFNPDGVIGYGYTGLNNGRGLPDTPGNRIILDNFLKNKDSSTIIIDQNAPNDSKKDIFGNTIPASSEAFADSGNTPVFDEKGVPTGLKKGSVFVSGFGYMSPKQYEEYLAKQTQGVIFVDSKSLDIHNQAKDSLVSIPENNTSTKRQSKPTEPTSFTIGGGKFTNSLGFVGGKTTFGDNVVDTLSEVLKLFPKLTAGQARDALSQNKGLTATQFKQINPDVINLSSEGKEKIPNVQLNASRGLSGLSPEEISSMLVRHVV